MAAHWQLPECRLLFHVKHDGELKANIAVAGGRKPAASWLRQAANGCRLYCADRGADYCLQAGLSPDLLVGDCDSSSAAVYAQARSLGAQVFVHPPAKDDTDLQLLLQQLPKGDVLATGVFGGRFDHLFSNVYSLLALKKQRNCRVLLADDEEFLLLLNGEEEVKICLKNKDAVRAVSLLPLSEACRVHIGGVLWPLDNAPLTQLRPYAVSNMPLENEFTCGCAFGSVGLYINWQK